ncbi:helix-turn-helix domain-containing protein [Knoellia sp. CPCC 206435]|uniref:helix-turn-helix domain-containing protein n=1 Tax=Knoellia terrae TaxID=3404797 RepID=UPI003B428D5F
MTPEQHAAQRAADIDRATGSLTVADSVGLALRDHRRRLGLSQRAYAAMRGWSASYIARLETGSGRYALDDLVEALEGTGFYLALVQRGEGASAAAEIVEPASWPETELVARVRDGSRRFPAHHETRAVTNPPNWWWHREFFHGVGPEPRWYAPRPTESPWPGTGDDVA